MKKHIIIILSLISCLSLFAQKKKNTNDISDPWFKFIQTENGSRLQLSFPQEFELMKENQTRGRTWYVISKDEARKTTYLLTCTFHDNILSEVGEENLVKTTFQTFEDASDSELITSEPITLGKYKGLKGQFLDKAKGMSYEYEAFQKAGLQIQLMIAHPYKIYEEAKYTQFFQSLKIE